jgi:signal transduction histidine kinase
MSDSRDLEAQPQAADRQRQRLLACLVRAEEDERRRIASDVHDDALQLMAAALMQAGEVRRSVTEAETTAKLQELEGLMQAAIGRLRFMLFDLRPPALDRDGLRAVLQRYLASRLDEPGVSYEITDDLDGEPPLETSLVAFRIAQEAITNIAKHARASTVTVALRRGERGLSIRITDDGRGFAADDGRLWVRHSGLRAMEERAQLFGGHLRLWSAPRAGTTVDLWLPEMAEGVTADPRGLAAGR